MRKVILTTLCFTDSLQKPSFQPSSRNTPKPFASDFVMSKPFSSTTNGRPSAAVEQQQQQQRSMIVKQADIVKRPLDFGLARPPPPQPPSLSPQQPILPPKSTLPAPPPVQFQQQPVITGKFIFSTYLCVLSKPSTKFNSVFNGCLHSYDSNLH